MLAPLPSLQPGSPLAAGLHGHVDVARRLLVPQPWVPSLQVLVPADLCYKARSAGGCRQSS